jgi:ankyrin repeat protein
MRPVMETSSVEQQGWTPLQIASQNGHLDVLQLVVDTRTAINIQNATQMILSSLVLSTWKSRAEV